MESTNRELLNGHGAPSPLVARNVVAVAQQESSKTVALLERIAQQLNVPVPEDSTETELAAPTDIRDVVSSLESVQPAKSHRGPKTHEGSTGNDPGPNLERPVRARPDDPGRGA